MYYVGISAFPVFAKVQHHQTILTHDHHFQSLGHSSNKALYILKLVYSAQYMLYP